MGRLRYSRVPDRGLPKIPILSEGLSLLHSAGAYEGDYIHGFVRDELERLGVRTFGDLRRTDGGDDPDLPAERRYALVVTATDITHGRLLRLPWDFGRLGLDPDEQLVADAVRASISIPLYFEPVIVRHGVTGEPTTLVDGGVLSNYPIEIFDRTDLRPPRWPTLGVKIVPSLPAGDRRPVPRGRAARAATDQAARAGRRDGDRRQRPDATSNGRACGAGRSSWTRARSGSSSSTRPTSSARRDRQRDGRGRSGSCRRGTGTRSGASARRCRRGEARAPVSSSAARRHARHVADRQREVGAAGEADDDLVLVDHPDHGRLDDLDVAGDRRHAHERDAVALLEALEFVVHRGRAPILPRRESRGRGCAARRAAAGPARSRSGARRSRRSRRPRWPLSVSREGWQPPARHGQSVLRVGERQDGAQRLALGVDVLEEAQLAVRAQHAAQLGAARRPGRARSTGRGRRRRRRSLRRRTAAAPATPSTTRRSGRRARVRRGLLGERAQVRLGLDGDDLVDGRPDRSRSCARCRRRSRRRGRAGRRASRGGARPARRTRARSPARRGGRRAGGGPVRACS